MTSAAAPEQNDAPLTRRLTATGLAIVIVLVVLGSAVAVLAFTRDDGAATSVEATREMISAIERNDGLGVLEQLPPGERKVLADPLAQLGTQLQRLGLIRETDDLSHIGGAQVSATDLDIRSTELAKDMDAVDLVGGTISVTFFPAGDAPLTDKGRELLAKDADLTIDPSGQTFTRDFSTDPLQLVAIREGGGWHVSLAYSIADAMRTEAGIELPAMGAGPPSLGADTPEAAVHDLLAAYANGDVERLITLMYPDEARSLYDYAPAFLPRAKDQAKAASDRKTYDVQLNHATTEVTGSGSTRSVRVTSFDVDIRDELKKTHLTYDGHCLHIDRRIGDNDAPYVSHDVCDGDTPPTQGVDGGDPITQLAIFGGGVDLPTFTVVERNGRWFISPARTLLDSTVATLQGLDANGVEAFASRLAAAWKRGAGDGISGTPIEAAPVLDGEPPRDDAAEAKATAAALVAACGELTTGAQADQVTNACIQRLVTTKRITPADVP